MKTLVLLSALIFIHMNARAECLDQDVLRYLKTVEKLENLIEVEFSNHKLIFSKDSCGANGCEVRIFTKTTPFCTKETLTTKGFYIDGTLSSSKVEIRSKGVIKRFQYFPSEMRFK